MAYAEDGPLDANRPDFTTNATVLAKGISDLEFGTTYQKTKSLHLWTGFESNYRAGLGGNWEFDLFAPDYTLSRSANLPGSWFDSGVGLTRHFGPSKGWDMAAGASTSLPTGSRRMAAGAANPSFFLTSSHDVGAKGLFTATGYVNWSHKGDAFFPAYSAVGEMSWETGPTSSGFAEVKADAAPSERPAWTLHFGCVFAHTATHQWDLHFGRTVVGGESENFFVGAGYSVKID
jgi:hypothetical protein